MKEQNFGVAARHLSMTEKTKKDHVEQALLEARKQIPSLKDAVAERVAAMLNEHSGVDLKKSEVQSFAKDLAELQTAQVSDQHEKQG